MNLEDLFFHSEKAILVGWQWLFGIEDFKMVNTACDKNGRILFFDAELNVETFY